MATNPPANDGAKPLILIVEDHDTTRAMLAAWVHSEGYRFKVATRAREAEALLAEQDFDLMLCDINLPDRDGPEIVGGITGRNEGLPVIFLTGNPTLETAMRSVQLRVVAYLVKPPNLDELHNLVGREVVAYRNRRILAASRSHLRMWDEELARLEVAPGAAEAQPLINYLQLSLRHFSIVLADLDRSVAALGADAEGRVALQQVDLVASLRKTVQVLERSKEHFKSKELGDLRRALDQLLTELDRPERGPAGP